MSVENLTDSELRTKLAEYGYPVGPVTQTTRKILVKKLKTLIEARESGNRGSSRHSLAAKYSSDDTDDDSVTAVRKKKSNSSRRQTLANPMPPPTSAPVIPRSPSKRRTATRSGNNDVSLTDAYVNLGPSEVVTNKSVKTMQKKVIKSITTLGSNDGLETGSDSDITEEPDQIYSSSKYKINDSVNKPPEAKYYDSKSYDAPDQRNVPINVSDYRSSVKSYDNEQRSVFASRDESYRTPAFKPNVSPILKEAVHRDANDDPLGNIETPYLSDFTRRLSRLSTSQLPAKQSFGTPILRHSRTIVVPEVKETDTNGHFSSLPAKYLTSATRYNTLPDRPIVARSFETDGKEIKNHHNLISIVLLGVLLLFFVVLAVVYLGLGGNPESNPTAPDKHFPLCSIDGNESGPNCWRPESLSTATELLERLRSLLMEKAISYNCDDVPDAPFIVEKDIISMFVNKNLNKSAVEEDLLNAESLILANPNSEISLVRVDESGEGFVDNKVLKTVDEVRANRIDGQIGMIVLKPVIPLKCLITNQLYPLLSIVLAIAVGALLIIGVRKLVVYYLKQKKESENEVFRLVSEIIIMLETHHQNCAISSPGGTQESYLAINHVRDAIIVPIKRKSMAGLWEKAVNFLDENESRVRREVQQVAGEEFHVWRWLPTNSLNTSNLHASNAGSKKSKVWQGQAFETMEGSVNSLPSSPTPCLKIRHMFDPDVEFEDDWEVKVQDAILEKCGEDVKILHIRVDRKSGEGCVYMKCLSKEEAGKAYRALHGWWFDSKLVTVKYLRLERYHERFPDATRCTTPLKPSNNQRLSMQSHNWQSPLETI